jgi:hypothetical protein
MPVQATSYSNLYKMPMGRAVFSLHEVNQRARAVGRDEIATLAGNGAEKARAVMRMQVVYRGGLGGQYPPETTAMDGLVDNATSSFTDYLKLQIRAYPGEPRALAAERLLRALVPGGAKSITSLPFAEEHAAVNTLLAMAAEPEHDVDIQLLPEGPELLDRLHERNREYGALLHQSDDIPSFDEIRAAQAEVQELLHATFCLIVGSYALDKSPDLAERDHLLEPLLRQNDALRATYRRRRTATDIDPETGEELPDSPDDGAPTDEPPTGELPGDEPSAPDDGTPGA